MSHFDNCSDTSGITNESALQLHDTTEVRPNYRPSGINVGVYEKSRKALFPDARHVSALEKTTTFGGTNIAIADTLGKALVARNTLCRWDFVERRAAAIGQLGIAKAAIVLQWPQLGNGIADVSCVAAIDTATIFNQVITN